MTPGDILMLTALLVVMLVAMALLVSGLGLVAHALLGPVSPPNETVRDKRPWRVEHLVYRHHRIAGTLITLGSAWFLWQFFQGPINGLADSAWSILWWGLAAAHACTLLIGLVILFRPSRLKPIESLANRRYDLGLTSAPVNATRSPALHGLLIAGIAAVVLVGMSLLLLERLGWMN